MNTIFDNFMQVLITVNIVSLFLWLSPLVIVLFVLGYFRTIKSEREYEDFLLTIDGTKFFCYNNRKKNKEFIEKIILPTLSSDIKVIYLDGKTPKSDYDQKFISRLLYSIKDRKGFPYLLKISNGQLVDKSISNDFYKTMNQNKDIGQLNKNIISFYQST